MEQGENNAKIESCDQQQSVLGKPFPIRIHMQSQKRDRRLGIFFIFIVLAIPSILAYYVSTPFHQKYFNSFLQERAKRFGAGNYDTEYAPTLPRLFQKIRFCLQKVLRFL